MRKIFRPHRQHVGSKAEKLAALRGEPQPTKAEFTFSLEGVQCRPVVIDQLLKSWTRIFQSFGYLGPHDPEVRRHTAIAIGMVFSTYTPEGRSAALQLMHSVIETAAHKKLDVKKDGDA